MPGYTSEIGVKQRSRATVTTDRYGKEAVVWAASPVTAVDQPVSIQPVSQTELPDGFRSQVSTVFKVISQPGQDLPLLDVDVIVWRDADYETIEVDRWPHPVILDGVHHVEALIQKVTG